VGREDCVFCQIIDKKISSEMIYEDDDLVAFHDISPQAPSHILIVPKEHIPNLSSVEDANIPLLGKMLDIARQIAKENHFGEKGFRVALNEGKDGGQTIYHLHMHLLSGRRLMWPPG
jgi:histidine triad (HIT) family protein